MAPTVNVRSEVISSGECWHTFPCRFCNSTLSRWYRLPTQTLSGIVPLSPKCFLCPRAMHLVVFDCYFASRTVFVVPSVGDKNPFIVRDHLRTWRIHFHRVIVIFSHFIGHPGRCGTSFAYCSRFTTPSWELLKGSERINFFCLLFCYCTPKIMNTIFFLFILRFLIRDIRKRFKIFPFVKFKVPKRARSFILHLALTLLLQYASALGLFTVNLFPFVFVRAS